MNKLAFSFLFICVACGEYQPDPGELPAHKAYSPKPVEMEREQARLAATADDFFGQRCAPCHGPEGLGNGIAAASLATHPRNFHDTRWQSSVDDRHIETIILHGGPSVGKSELMPSNPDLSDKPAIVSALRKKIRAFGGRRS